MLVEDTKKYFDECNVALVDKFVPFFCSSIGCHLANMENKKREFYIRQGSVQDLRMHIFFVAPPGFSKTLMLKSFLGNSNERSSNYNYEDDEYDSFNSTIDLTDKSVLSRSPVGTAFEGVMNEASYVGTIKQDGNDVKIIKGAAFQHRYSILGVDEFSVLSDTMSLSYGKNLDKALLTTLDDGYVKKRLSLGSIQYTTQLTLWSGSQPMRFDLSSGIGRRFFFIYFIPTKKEEEMIKDMSRRENQKLPSEKILRKISDDIELMKANISKIKNISFDESVYDILDKFDVPHFEEELFRRLAIGYKLASTENIDKNLVISMDDELKSLFKKEANWRKEIKKGPEVSQVIRILEDRGIMRISDLKTKLTDFGLSYKQATKALSDLRNAGVIKKETDNTSNKPVNYVRLTDLA